MCRTVGIFKNPLKSTTLQTMILEFMSASSTDRIILIKVLQLSSNVRNLLNSNITKCKKNEKICVPMTFFSQKL